MIVWAIMQCIITSVRRRVASAAATQHLACGHKLKYELHICYENVQRQLRKIN